MSEAKLDQKYGVDLQNIYISGGARLAQTLVAGDIDMATTGGAVINAVLSGADLVYVALIVPTYGFSVYARPDVKDIASLKGKIVGVMTKGASSDHSMIAVLRHNLRKSLASHRIFRPRWHGPVPPLQRWPRDCPHQIWLPKPARQGLGDRTR